VKKEGGMQLKTRATAYKLSPVLYYVNEKHYECLKAQWGKNWPSPKKLRPSYRTVRSERERNQKGLRCYRDVKVTSTSPRPNGTTWVAI